MSGWTNRWSNEFERLETNMWGREEMALFFMGIATGITLTVAGTWLAFKCLEWRGIW